MVSGPGSGTPTTGALSELPGLPDNLLTYGYAFADLTGAGYVGTSLDTVYIANGSSRGGTIDKYRWTGASRTLADATRSARKRRPSPRRSATRYQTPALDTRPYGSTV